MNEPMIATIMSQAQAFASSWSLVGSRFEADDQLEQAEAEKAELRRMVAELIAERDALRAQVEAAEASKTSYKNAFEISENTVRDLTEKVIPNIREKLEAAENLLAGVCEQYEEEKTKARAFEQELEARKKQESVIDTVIDYLVSISAHVAHQDDATAQAEIGDLLKMLAAGAQGEEK